MAWKPKMQSNTPFDQAFGRFRCLATTAVRAGALLISLVTASAQSPPSPIQDAVPPARATLPLRDPFPSNLGGPRAGIDPAIDPRLNPAIDPRFDPADVTEATGSSLRPPDQHSSNAGINSNAGGDTAAGDDDGLAGDRRIEKLFGEVDQLRDLPPLRKNLALAPSSDAVFGAEATGRKTRDIGDLLRQSKSAHGVSVQNRTPIISDTRVRGQRVGQVLASGSYWAPARMDLDTMMNKIDSRLIDDVILIKGPYATRYGPGHRFVDLEFIHSPRYTGGTEHHGLSGVTYNTNGEQWSGRQSLWGGGQSYGYHISYGHQTGNDYETGSNGFFLPTSYKSRDLFAAFGRDLSDHETIELNILRLDQTDVEFPGLVFDLNFLVTEGYEVVYTNENFNNGNRFVAEVWYNRTRFEGDTLRPGKNRQIPSLRFELDSPTGTDGFAVTDGDALSGGYRFSQTIFEPGGSQVTFGTDLIVLNQELNDIEPFSPSDDNNFPIPRSSQVDVGVFVETVEKLTERTTVTSGARVDGVFTDAREFVDGVPGSLVDIYDAETEQEFLLAAAYITGEHALDDSWTIDGGFGISHRPPTLTELYVENAFIGSLQRGITFLAGDPELESEKAIQFDLGTRYRSERLQAGLSLHHAWIHDYITYELIDPAGAIDGLQEGAEFVNTDLATLAGFETYGNAVITPMASVFGIISFVEGRDHSRVDPSRLSPFDVRGDAAEITEEPLPGISPLEMRLGVLLHDPTPADRWGVEWAARVVDNQDRVATTLQEIRTPGFTTFDLRSYVRSGDWLVTAGVENFTDKFYREHIDYRSGLGVFRPGINFYFGGQTTY